MAYPLKELLKSLKVLFISKKEYIEKKELDILEMFFYKVIISHSHKKSIELFSNEHPDVIISDIEPLELHGLQFCKKTRQINSSIPIIIMSKNKEEDNLFEAIRMQVIDYIVRPTKPDKLIYALNQTAKHIVNHGNITVKLSNNNIYDYKEKTIIKVDGSKTKLTKNEFRLLELLLANKHSTLSKEEIEASLWANGDITESAFKSLFSRLRQKIGKECIQNSFGIGYQLL